MLGWAKDILKGKDGILANTWAYYGYGSWEDCSRTMMERENGLCPTRIPTVARPWLGRHMGNKEHASWRNDFHGGIRMADIGYLRHETDRQEVRKEEIRLKDACQVVYEDEVRPNDIRRPELSRMLSALTNGDVLHIRTLLDLGGSTRDLLLIVGVLMEKGVELVSLEEGIDTRNPGGKVVFNVFSTLSKLDKESIGEWEKKYIAAAKKRAKKN